MEALREYESQVTEEPVLEPAAEEDTRVKTQASFPKPGLPIYAKAEDGEFHSAIVDHIRFYPSVDRKPKGWGYHRLKEPYVCIRFDDVE